MELVPFVLAGFVALGGYLIARRQRRREARAYQRLVTRDRLLEPTAAPLGLDREQLRARWECLPEGDREYGVEHGVEGPVTATVAERSLRLDCATFRWWWEQRSGNQRGSGGYDRQRTTVAAVRLPAAVPTPIRLQPESVLGRLGVTRGGRQMESSEFNRRFRVSCADDHLAVMFLDAHMQATLTDAFGGRSIELVDDVLLLEGRPTHRDDSLAGGIGELPAVRQDAARLVSVVSEQVWRQLGMPGPVGSGGVPGPVGSGGMPGPVGSGGVPDSPGPDRTEGGVGRG